MVPLVGGLVGARAGIVSISSEAAPLVVFTSVDVGGRSGDGALSDSRLEERRLRGERGRSAEDDGGGRSLSLFLPLPKPNAEPRFEDDLPSGEEARPYG